MQEIKQKERAFDKKYLDRKIALPLQAAVTSVPVEDQKQIHQYQEKEEAVSLISNQTLPGHTILPIKFQSLLPFPY
jgi:hypothetical protein